MFLLSEKKNYFDPPGKCEEKLFNNFPNRMLKMD